MYSSIDTKHHKQSAHSEVIMDPFVIVNYEHSTASQNSHYVTSTSLATAHAKTCTREEPISIGDIFCLQVHPQSASGERAFGQVVDYTRF